MDDDPSSELSAVWAELNSAVMFTQMARSTDDLARRLRAMALARLAVLRVRRALRHASVRGPDRLKVNRILDELAAALGELDA